MIQVSLGHSGFQQQFCEKYPVAIEGLEFVEIAVNEVFRTPGHDPLQTVCRYLAKTVANSFSSVCLLCANGFGPDSMKIVRGMFEATITLMYLTACPKDLPDYMDYRRIVDMKRQRDIETYAPELLKKIKAESVDAIRREYDQIVSRFIGKNGKPRSRWSRQTLLQLAKEVGMAQHYFTVYGFGSALQHGGMDGIAMQLDTDPEVVDVDIAPSTKWVKEAFRSAYALVVLALCEYIDLARPEMQDTKRELLSTLEMAFKDADG